MQMSTQLAGVQTMFVLLGNSPVEELFVLAEPNKWWKKQINHNLLSLIVVH